MVSAVTRVRAVPWGRVSQDNREHDQSQQVWPPSQFLPMRWGRGCTRLFMVSLLAQTSHFVQQPCQAF